MNPYLIPGLSLSPLAFRRLVAMIPEGRLDERLDLTRFSPREVVAHLADWEPLLRERVRQAVERPGSKIVGEDETRRAKERRYDQSDVANELDSFDRERRKTVEYVQSLRPEDFEKVAIHTERGPLSARDLVEMLVGHDMYHVEQLTNFLGPKVAGTW